MDSHVDYPSAKRRRTSESRSTSRSRSPSRTPTRSRRDSPRARSRSYSRSRSRSPAGRRRHSPSESSHYATPRRSRSRDGSQYKSRSLSPVVRNRGSMSNPSNRRLRFLPLQTLPRAHVRGITCAKFSPDGALLATASADATINIYSVPSNPSLPSSISPEKQETPPHSEFKHIRTLRGHLAGVNALSWSPISTGSAAAPITTAGAAARTVTPADATSTNNKFYTLASASDDKTIMLWSPLSSDTPISPSPLTGHSNYVSTLCFSPKGNMLVSGSYDEAVWLWDVRSGRCMRQLPAHSDPVRGVDFICDGTMVCSCSTDGLIRIWDSGTGQCLQTLVDEDRKGVTGVLWAPNGRYLLAWTLDACVRLWDYVGGRCVKTYQGHVNGEFSLGGAIGTYFLGSGGDEAEADAPEAQAAFVASGSEDGDVVVWDVTTKEVLWRGEGHRDVVLSVDCTQSKDGGRGLMVSVGRDRALKVWIEDVDDQALHKRKARLLHQQHYQQHNHGAELNGHYGGYAVDEDEDVDAQILEMEGQQQHQHHGEDMEVEVTVNGGGGGGGGRDNGHAMEIDTAA